MIRPLSLLAVAFLSMSAWAQQPERLAYATPAKSVLRIAEELKEKGVPISFVDPAVASDIVYVRCKEMATDTLLQHLAKATYARWVKKEDGTLRLVSNADALKEIKRKREAERVAQIATGLDKLRKELARLDAPAKQDPDSEADPRQGMQMFGGGSGPEAKLLLRMITMAAPAQLAKLEKGQRIVYSTSPTRMQLAMTIPGGAIQEFLTEYNKAAETDAKQKPDENDGSMDEGQAKMMREMMTIFNPNVNREKLEGMPAKVLLVISSGGGPGFMAMFGGTDSVNANLYIFNAKGTVIGQAERSLADTGMFSEIMEAVAERTGDTNEEEKPDEKLIPSKDGEIQFSKATKEIEKLMSFDNPMEAFRAVVSKETLELFARPDEHDPLSFRESDSLDAVAKANGWSVVANLSDGNMDISDLITAGGKAQGAKQYFNQLQRNKNLKVEVGDGLLSVRPADPEEMRATRVDRVSLAKLIAACRAKSVPSLDDLADFAAKNEPPSMGEVSATYFFFFATNAMQFMMDGFQSWDMLKLYGNLSTTQREALKRGESIPFAQITGPAARQLTKMVYGAPTKLRVEEQMKSIAGMGIMGEFMSMMPMPMRDFRTEPTEVAPNGLPTNGYLECKSVAETFVQVMGEGEASQRAMMSTGAREVALFRFLGDSESGFGEAMPKFERFRPGERLTMNLKVRLSPASFVSGTLTDDKIDGNAKTVSFDQLPADFQKSVAQRIELFKKTGFGMGMPGRRAPVP